MPDPQSKVRPVPDRLHVRQSGPVTDRALLDFQFTGGAAACPADPAGGTIAVAVEALAGDREVWSGSAPAERGRLGSFTVHRSGGWLALHADCRIDRGDVATPVRRLYREALKLLRASEFPHLVRVWNYLPDITAAAATHEPVPAVLQRPRRGAGRTSVSVPTSCQPHRLSAATPASRCSSPSSPAVTRRVTWRIPDSSAPTATRRGMGVSRRASLARR
jgi:hypothetical protein